MNPILRGAVLVFAVFAGSVRAQTDVPSKVPAAWNRYHTVAEIEGMLKSIASAYPEIATLASVGKSLQGRDMWVLTIHNPKTGKESEKPAMWIDGGIHANEIQSVEAVLYTAWYLTKMHGVNAPLTALMDRTTIHLMPMVSPDSRDAWFAGPSTPHNYRSNLRPVDNDRDGRFDEDGPDDLDGDGQVTQMWKADPAGRWERDKDDPRIFRRRPDDKPAGGWTRLGEEGIDNDGDGEVNEDGPGGDDMNRNWPAGWLPGYVQWGAGPFPLSAPETRAAADFIAARPNIAAAQSYHNTGGMILRGPGAGFREWAYPREDVAVYDEIARLGEEMLPYYRSMIIHKDLYTVHGGFVNWVAESLGIFSFTNELWTEAKYFQRDVTSPDERRDWLWTDRMVFGQNFAPYKEVEHPTHGKVLVGGLNKWSSRSTPTFMLEEECHRNFAFTMLHADQMPLLVTDRAEAVKVGDGLYAVTVEIRNTRAIPTRSGHAANKRIGAPDLLTATVEGGIGGERVIAASGRLDGWLDTKPRLVEREPGRVPVNEGIGGRGTLTWRFFAAAGSGAKVRITYESDKAQTVTRDVTLP
jgi:hypothetical protein